MNCTVTTSLQCHWNVTVLDPYEEIFIVSLKIPRFFFFGRSEAFGDVSVKLGAETQGSGRNMAMGSAPRAAFHGDICLFHESWGNWTLDPFSILFLRIKSGRKFTKQSRPHTVAIHIHSVWSIYEPFKVEKLWLEYKIVTVWIIYLQNISIQLVSRITYRISWISIIILFQHMIHGSDLTNDLAVKKPGESMRLPCERSSLRRYWSCERGHGSVLKFRVWRWEFGGSWNGGTPSYLSKYIYIYGNPHTNHYQHLLTMNH